MKDFESIEDHIKQLRFEDIKYIKGSGHDQIHTLFPLESNDYLYALQTNENVNVKNIIHNLFCSLDEDGALDVDGFIESLEMDYDKKKHIVNKEYMMADCLASAIVGASKDFSRAIREVEINECNHISYITLGRLPATFQSAAILIKNGFHYETTCLFRVILEQIAYAYQCSKSTPENIEKIKPHASITILKSLFETAGSMNGYFSNFIHHNKNIWNEFIDDEFYIISRSGKKSKSNIMFLAHLSEIYMYVMQDIYIRLKKENDDELFLGLINVTLQLIQKIKIHFKEKL